MNSISLNNRIKIADRSTGRTVRYPCWLSAILKKGLKLKELAMKKEITQKRLKEVFKYDKETGVFTYRHRLRSRERMSSRSGKVAGCFSRGRVILCLDYKHHFAHRLAWLYVYGYLPEHGIDHINRDPSDNRIVNLREASQSCNMRNYGNNIKNRSGVKGVCFDTWNNKWCAYITVNKKHKKLGRYVEKHEAVLARVAAEQCLNWERCDVCSPAYKYALKNNLIRK